MENFKAKQIFMANTGDVLDGRFELVELLGEGAQGLVWKATDLQRSKGPSPK